MAEEKDVRITGWPQEPAQVSHRFDSEKPCPVSISFNDSPAQVILKTDPGQPVAVDMNMHVQSSEPVQVCIKLCEPICAASDYTVGINIFDNPFASITVRGRTSLFDCKDKPPDPPPPGTPPAVTVSHAPSGAIYPTDLVTFNATATGDAPLSYAWTLDGSPVGTDSFTYGSTLAEGEHVVGVKVTNRCGSDGTSDLLTILPPPPPPPIPPDTRICVDINKLTEDQVVIDSLTYQGLKEDQVVMVSFTYQGYTFKPLRKPLRFMELGDPQGVIKLGFPPSGMRIEFPGSGVKAVTLTVNNYGGPRLHFIAYYGNEILDEFDLPIHEEVKTVEFPQPRLTAVEMTRGGESSLIKVCHTTV